MNSAEDVILIVVLMCALCGFVVAMTYRHYKVLAFFTWFLFSLSASLVVAMVISVFLEVLL